jgi:hypothetical protein
LITATLYPWSRSLIGLLAVQAILAALIPWLIYKTLLYASKPLAICGALLSVVTLLPYQFQNLLYPDQVEVFLGILLCYVVVRYYFAKTTTNMLWMFLVYAYDAFFRPTSLLLYLVLLAVVPWRDRERRRDCLKPFALMSIGAAGLFVGAAALDAHLYDGIHHYRPSLVGRTAFYNPFVNSMGVEGAFEDGQYTKILRAKFADELMRERTVDTFWKLLRASNTLGEDQGDPLFMKVALEQYWLHPVIAWNVVTRGLPYYVGLRPPDGQPTFFPFTFESDPDEFPYGPGMAAYIERIVGQQAMAAVRAAFAGYSKTIFATLYRILLPTGTLLTGLGVLVALYLICRGRSPPELPVFLIVLSVYLLYVGPMVILVGPLFRYVCASALFLLMSGLISLRMQSWIERSIDK